MRRIIKGQEPEELRNWKAENAHAPENLTFKNMPKRDAKLQMLAEQGHLCAYTMESIQTEDHCHIEHVVPQSQPNQPPHFAIDYNNLVACFPGKKPPPAWNPKYPYGAQKKGGTNIDENSFVSPLSEDVERRFRYAPDGSIEAALGDAAAANSIQILALDHDQLKELRKAAIDERVLDRSLSAEDAEALSIEFMTTDSAGRLPEFCLAISQVAAWYAIRMRDTH
jgi:uncharacterized protein (TIGR02646 family)